METAARRANAARDTLKAAKKAWENREQELLAKIKGLENLCQELRIRHSVNEAKLTHRLEEVERSGLGNRRCVAPAFFSSHSATPKDTPACGRRG